MIDLQQWFVLLKPEPKQRPVADGMTDNTPIFQAWADYQHRRNHPRWVVIWPVSIYVLRYRA